MTKKEPRNRTAVKQSERGQNDEAKAPKPKAQRLNVEEAATDVKAGAIYVGRWD